MFLVRRSIFNSLFIIAGIHYSVFIMACAPGEHRTVRVATFNASLNRREEGQLLADLATGTDSQAQAVAEIVQRVRPDILLVNEFDHDDRGAAAKLFHDHYLAQAQNVSGIGATEPIEYPYWYTATVNTGVASGFDLDNNGRVGSSGVDYGGDALGFGFFPGQFGMVLYSRFPIDEERVRTFQNFRWLDMPDARLPVDVATGRSWYSDRELAVLPLSSKSHWDVPIRIDGQVLHMLVSHPTPPVFDGPEDRNGRRNHDEIRLWHDYVTPGAGDYLYDDHGIGGGLMPNASFVIAGDQNADPHDGDGDPAAIRLLLESARVHTSASPASEGGSQQARHQDGVNDAHEGDPSFDTSDFGDEPPSPGNLRLDYVLPSADLEIIDAGVFWPASDDPLYDLVRASDHRLVWVDVAVGG